MIYFKKRAENLKRQKVFTVVVEKNLKLGALKSLPSAGQFALPPGRSKQIFDQETSRNGFSVSAMDS